VYGKWCTPDSIVQGDVTYYIPGHQDTAVLIEKVTLTNTGASALGNFLIGEEVDWDCDQDSAKDEGGIDFARKMVWQHGDHKNTSYYGACMPYSGYDANLGGAVVNGYTYAYYSLGWYPDTIYNYLSNLDGDFTVFADSVNGCELRSVYRFYEGTLGAGSSLTICKLKAFSLTGLANLQALLDKGVAFMEKYDICQQACQGLCGDANQDASVDVSDAVWIINYVFVGGNPPQPILACGDANSDASVDVSDAVWVINYVFVGGAPPSTCSPGAWGASGGDCCPFQ